MNITYIFYNKEIFKKYHIDVPKTFDELKQAGEVLKKTESFRQPSALKTVGRPPCGLCIWPTESAARPF